MPKKNKSRIYKGFLSNLIGILLFSLILANVSLPDFSSLSSFNPAERNVDFCSTDFYQMVADKRSEKVLDDRIVIVPIDILSRMEIKQLLEDISLCNPQAIGMDVFFQFPMEGDDGLLDVLQHTSGLITPMGVIPHASDTLEIIDAYLLDSLQLGSRGIVNMNIARRYHVVRDFKPFYQTSRGEVPHFVLALARESAPDVVENWRKQNEGNFTAPIGIDFASREFEIIDSDEVLERIDDIEGKIVLLGAVKDTQDIHITPIDDSMPGILIHAHALSTVLRQNYKNQMPQWALWAFGIFVCALFVGAKNLLSSVTGGGTLMRLFQLFMMLLIVYIGCVLYLRFNFVLELSLPLAVLALGLMALDYWQDFHKIIIKILKHMNIKFFQRFLFALLFSCIASVGLQAAPFRIFKFEGDVKIRQQDTWVAVTDRQDVTIRDQFVLGENAKLAIVDYDTRRIYYTTKVGKQNVAQIISAAKKESDRIASNMRKQLVASAGQDKPVVILGGVNRGSEEQANGSVGVYREIYHQLKDAKNRGTGALTAEKVTRGEDWYFKISNHSSVPLFVNVVRIPQSEGDKPQLCLEVGYTENQPYLMIAPGTETELSHYAFLAEEVTHNYLVFACEEPYDCQALKMLLNIFAPPQDIPQDKKPTIYFYVMQ